MTNRIFTLSKCKHLQRKKIKDCQTEVDLEIIEQEILIQNVNKTFRPYLIDRAKK